MSAHTPGPWPLTGWTAPDDYGWSIKIGDAPHRLDVSAWDESSEADARLIAASPELLEAVRHARDALNLAAHSLDLREVDRVVRAARGACDRAIAKAVGP